MNLDPVREIFVKALSYTSTSERSAYLAEVCGDNNAGLRKQVERYLEAHENAGSFLNEPAADLVSPTELDPLTEGPGTSIGPYKLLQKLGEGGFGVVYMAEQHKPILRRVALKIIKLGMDTKQVVGRFEAVRQALAMMDHPNIAKVLEAGSTETGRPYFVMELVRGVPITEYCDQANLTIKERLRLFMEVCQAVQHAHQKGIIHRDLKPNNVLVTLHDGVAVPKVIDFGIAKATQHRLTDITVFTQLQQFVGTPAYMSPEQAEMSGLDIDTRSDIYSLGVMLYELLAGRTPFDGRELLKAGIDAMRYRIREVEPDKPSTALSTLTDQDRSRVAKHRNEESARISSLLRGEVDWIIMKAMEKDRTRRYETASAFRSDLTRFLNEEPVEAAAPSPLYKAKKFARRHRIAVVTGLGIAALLIVSTVVTFVSADKAIEALKSEKQARITADIQKRIAVEEKENAEANAQEARRQQYVSDMSAAQANLDDDNLQATRDRLQVYLPENLGEEEEDLRGFEWYYLWEESKGDQLASLEGHVRNVSGLGFSPDSRLLLTAGADKTLRLWDWDTQREILQFPVTEWAGYTQFSAEGDYFRVKVGDEGMIWRREGHSYSPDKTLFPINMSKFVFSPAQNHVASRMPNGSVRLYDLNNREIVGEYVRNDVSFFHAGDIRFSLDGRFLANQVSTDTAVVIQTDTMEVVKQMENRKYGVAAILLFSPDSERLMLSALGEGAVFWDWRKGVKLEPEPFRNRRIMGAAFSPDGRFLATAETDHLVHLWDAVTLDWLRSYRGHLDEVQRIQFTPSGDRIVTGSQDGRILVWDPLLENGDEHVSGLNFVDDPPKFSPGGNFVALDSVSLQEEQRDGGRSELPLRLNGVDLYNVKQKRRIHLDGPQNCIGFRADGEALYSLGCDGEALDPDPNYGSPVTRLDVYRLDGGLIKGIPLELEGDFTVVSDLSLTRNQVALGSMDGMISLFELDTGRRVARWQAQDQPVYHLRFSPDGRWLASNQYAQSGSESRWGPESKVLKLWELGGEGDIGEPVVLEHPFRLVSIHEFSPDSKQIAYGGNDGTIILWDIASGRILQTLVGHKAGCLALSFSHDGKTLVSGGAEKRLFFWNVNTGRQLMTQKTENGICSLSFSPSDDVVAIQTYSKTRWVSDNCHFLRAPVLDSLD